MPSAPENIDINDQDGVLACLTEVVKLRNILTDKWINPDRFVAFLDHNRDGEIHYDEFYDGLSQFGIVEDVDVDKVFSYMDKSHTGNVQLSTMLDVLLNSNSAEEEAANTPEEEDDDDEVEEEFPETLLVGLVAHNNLKSSMMKFVKSNLHFFKRVNLVTTGSTGRALSALGLHVDTLVSSGPLGGDQEIGGMIARGQVAAVFFFTDPLSSHPHQPDIEALNRICCVHDTMFANNPSTAQALVYALEYSAFGFSRLTGIHPTYLKEDTHIVKEYKSNQKKVISSVQDSHGRKSVLKGSILRASVARSSIIHAPPRFSILKSSTMSGTEEFLPASK